MTHLQSLKKFCLLTGGFWIISLSPKAQKHCELQPADYTGSRASLKAFEKNIENKMSDIYQVEYPTLYESLKELQKRTKELKRFVP